MTGSVDSIRAWLLKATPEQVLERLVRAEHEAFLWYIAVTMTERGAGLALAKACEAMAETLREGGFVRPDLESPT